MSGVKTMFRFIFDRRKCNQPIQIDKRQKRLRPCDAEKEVWDSIQRLGDAIKNKTQTRQ